MTLDHTCPHCGTIALQPGWQDTVAGRFCAACKQYENLPDAAEILPLFNPAPAPMRGQLELEGN